MHRIFLTIFSKNVMTAEGISILGIDSAGTLSDMVLSIVFTVWNVDLASHALGLSGIVLSPGCIDNSDYYPPGTTHCWFRKMMLLVSNGNHISSPSSYYSNSKILFYLLLLGQNFETPTPTLNPKRFSSKILTFPPWVRGKVSTKN